jgi:Ca2+-binding RTX toxin-like protein
MTRSTATDVAFLGAGDDVFVWDPGDGSDIVEGQDGIDTMLFNGSAGDETFAVSANGGRTIFTRNLGNIVMDLNDVERITLNALGGVDNVTVGDLSGTDVTDVAINLAATGGGGDGAVDTVTINATNGDDIVLVAGNNGGVSVLGLSAAVTIFGFEQQDRLVVNGLAGDDVVDASGLVAAILLTGNGGDGNDVLIGGNGPDTLNGGAGDDVLLGGPGIDVLDGGTGSNVVIQGSTRPLGIYDCRLQSNGAGDTAQCLHRKVASLGSFGAQLVGDPAPLGSGSVSIVLGKGGRDEGGDDGVLPLSPIGH